MAEALIINHNTMKINKIVLIVFVLAVAIAGYFYVTSEINRKSPSMANSPEDFVSNTTDLLDEYQTNPAEADKKYLGKIILLSGNIKSLETSEKGFHTIVLGDSSSMSSVRCSMDNSIALDVGVLPIGTAIVLRGECTGFNPDDLGLGADVVLNRGVLIKTKRK
ncbi:tRNA_anti-like [Daejeonella rubra]|uniref:tRNA_anti-like n=2 Tax=Daejeonella rubra TaxID=990371 RepID=A0A1G9VI82_9SPHI|nr:tRNA_anti-like [Daejeonella rubra]